MVLAVVLIVSFASAQPVMLTDSLSTSFGEFILTAPGTVVFVNSNGTLSSVNVDDPFNTIPIQIGWLPDDDGWDGPGEIKFMKSSSNGELICIGIQVAVPDSVLQVGLSMPDPVVMIVCNSLGEDAQVIGVTEDFGEEFSFDFTMDSRLLYGAGLLPCNSDPESYFAYHLGDESSSISPYDVVDLEEGVRFSTSGIIRDRFISNRWSDLIAAGAEPLGVIADMTTFSIVHEDSAASSATIEQWIEPDAGLAQMGERQIIRFSDGTVYENQEEPFIILCRLSEGHYLFTRNGGETISTGIIDWSIFAEEESTEMTELAGYISLNSRIRAFDTGIIFSAGRGLYYYEF